MLLRITVYKNNETYYSSMDFPRKIEDPQPKRLGQGVFSIAKVMPADEVEINMNDFVREIEAVVIAEAKTRGITSVVNLFDEQQPTPF